MSGWKLVSIGLLGFAGCSPAAGANAFSQVLEPAHSAVGPEAELVVRVVGLRNRSGSVLILVHNQEAAFPGDADSALEQARLNLSDLPSSEDAHVMFRLPRQEVGVAVFHDENDNHELDTSFIGIPTEGLGASNDAQGMFGPPDYDDAKVRLVQPRSQLDIELVYFL